MEQLSESEMESIFRPELKKKKKTVKPSKNKKYVRRKDIFLYAL